MSGGFGVTNAQPTQPGQNSATVIPFPQRPAAQPATRHVPLLTGTPPTGTPPTGAPLTGTPKSEQERLSHALESLNAALAEQRAALKAWRGAMSELKASTTALEDSLQRYRGNLRSLGSSVSALHHKARSLEAWADGAMEGTVHRAE